MKIISYNVNGIRAAFTKNFLGWLQIAAPDIICIQESKAGNDQIDIQSLEKIGYHSFWHSAQRKGYSGVGIACKSAPDKVIYGCGIEEFDNEGRIIRADFSDFSVLSIYVPSGANENRIAYKMKFCENLLTYIQNLQKEIPNLVLCGDFNISHFPIDIHDPVRLQHVSGFLPEERAWLSRFLLECNLIDTFRIYNNLPENYTWWSYRQNARARNKGWRLDYQFITKNLQKQLTRAVILREVFHSDHCPILVEMTL